MDSESKFVPNPSLKLIPLANPTSIPKRVERVQRARKGASSPAKLDLNLPQYFEVQSPDKEETEEWSEEQKEGAIDEEEYNSEDESTL